MTHPFNAIKNAIVLVLLFMYAGIFAQTIKTNIKKNATTFSPALASPQSAVPSVKNTDTPVKEVNTINDLRTIVGNPDDIVYVKYHTAFSDGGGGNFIWRNDSILTSHSYFGKDNNGTYIKAKNNNNGRWVRQYSGPVSISFFGANLNNANKALQSAIDFAYNNQNDYSPTMGTTVYIPAGAWLIDAIELRSGVEIIGDSEDFTILYAKQIGDKGLTNAPYMFEIPEGPVKISMSNLKIFARDDVHEKGCFHFKAAPGPADDGGLWLSTFKKIEITGFKGNGMYFEAGSLPHQFCIFEQVQVSLGKGANPKSNALKMTGQHGQMTFINCAFNGYRDDTEFHRGSVISIAHTDNSFAAVVSFINCTIQEADYGININYAENITIDNCWFESLGVAVTIDGTDHENIKNTNFWCRGINVLNNRFANAAGFGTIPASASNIQKGICVNVINSQVKVANNYVAVSDLNSERLDNDYFIIAKSLEGDVNPGIEVSGNCFAIPKLGRTAGIIPVAAYIVDNTLECRHNKTIIVNQNAKITFINATINAGETLYVKAGNANITFKETGNGNIKLSNKGSLDLEDGEVAGFTKLDTPDGGEETYQLISVIKNQ